MKTGHFSELSRGLSKKNRHVFIVEFIRLITKVYFVCLEAKLPSYNCKEE